jgi:hypothetical protein
MLRTEPEIIHLPYRIPAYLPHILKRQFFQKLRNFTCLISSFHMYRKIYVFVKKKFWNLVG